MKVYEGDKDEHDDEDAIDRLRSRRLLALLDAYDKRAVHAHARQEQTGRLREKVDHERVGLAEELAQVAHIHARVHFDEVVATAGEQRANVNDREQEQVAKRGVFLHGLAREHIDRDHVSDEAEREQQRQKDLVEHVRDLLDANVLLRVHFQ